MDVRQRTMEWHRAMFSPYACGDERLVDRERPMEPCPLRTDFQRDRDRILHCKAFRRMKHKTQCFLAPEGDHFRTRLTHTLEVAQIARTAARALRLNEDLTEAIALGHDLGHTPFGHMGERILNALYPGGFHHAEQSLRVVERLEGEGKGLNLTLAVRDGIREHTSHGHPKTLEGAIVSLADRIAYVNHDIDDAIRAGVLRFSELPRELLAVLGETHGKRIDTLIFDLYENSRDADTIRMSPRVYGAMMDLRAFLFAQVYTRREVTVQEKKAEFLIRSLYAHYTDHPEEMPEEYRACAEQEGVGRAVCDYVAGMTDNYAVRRFEELFIPVHQVLV
ncbi:MAG: deoxyguanosinetriphosphate triphosphohydrolase [Candidatus Spyradocola sp.]|jgi:dGTPase